MIKRVTEIVILSSFLALTAACSHERTTQNAKVGLPPGGQTAMGKALQDNQWCSSMSERQQNVYQTVLTLRPSGDFLLTRYQLTTQAQLQRDAEDKGRWGLINNQLLLVLTTPGVGEGRTIQREVILKRAEQNLCIDLVGPDKTQTFCACSDESVSPTAPSVEVLKNRQKPRVGR